jgi:hypothetical protein
MQVRVGRPWIRAELLHNELSVRLKDEVALKRDTDDLLKKNMWSGIVLSSASVNN